jgi:hypothetical protein
MSISPLSKEQMEVWALKSMGYSYDKIQRRLHWNIGEGNDERSISCHRTIVTALKRTALEERWELGMKTIPIYYLNAEDTLTFQQFIEECASDLACVNTFEAKSLAYTLYHSRVLESIEKLKSIHCFDIAFKVEQKYLNQEPPREFMKNTCSRIGIDIRKAQGLELLRRQYCTRNTIENF